MPFCSFIDFVTFLPLFTVRCSRSVVAIRSTLLCRSPLLYLLFGFTFLRFAFLPFFVGFTDDYGACCVSFACVVLLLFIVINCSLIVLGCSTLFVTALFIPAFVPFRVLDLLVADLRTVVVTVAPGAFPPRCVGSVCDSGSAFVAFVLCCSCHGCRSLFGCGWITLRYRCSSFPVLILWSSFLVF